MTSQDGIDQETPARPQDVIGALAASAARWPDEQALHDLDGTWTFAEVLGAALDLAGSVEDLPPGPIGLVIPSRAATVIAEFGLAAAGRTFVPLDPTYPLELLRDIVAVTETGAVLAPPDQLDLAGQVAGSRPVRAWEPERHPTAGSQVEQLGPDADLCVYFTSGSTGGPKGVIHTQRNWVDAGLAFADTGISNPGRTFLLMSPMTFAASGIITSFALFGGSALSIYDARSRGLSDLPAWVRDNGITTLASIPSAVRALIAAAGGEPLGAVDHVVYGGEMVTRADVLAARSLGPAVDVTLLYVSTELGLIAFRTIRWDDPLPDEEPIHAGWAPPHGRIDRVRILGEDGRPCEEGDAGTIEVTSARMSWFVGEDRAGQEGDEMVSLTGDLGALMPDGGLQILGRTDQLVKIRGYRIDQAEVERHLRDLDEVADVCVVVGQTGRGTAQLVAHVVPAAPDLRPADVRERLRDVLPAYMIPARIFMAESLPRLRNGKVDRVTLRLAAKPQPGADGTAIGRQLSTPTEKAVAEAFASVLGIDEVGADDDFFDLGGSSLEVAELLVRLQAALGVPVPASLLTHHGTPEQLASAIDGQGDERPSTVTLQGAAGTKRPPIALIYDLHGSPFRMRGLAQALGADQPVLGFESPLIYGEPGGPRSVAEFAALHVRDLRRVQPHGPYHLCGYSMGSTLMWEMTAQLLAQGEEVGLSAAIDFGPVYLIGRMPRRDGPKPPGSYPLRAPARARGADRLRFHLDQLAGKDPLDRFLYLARKARLGREAELAAARLDLRRHDRVRPELRAAWTWHGLIEATGHWDPPVLDHAVDVFVCDQTADGNIMVSRRIDHATRTEPALGWDEYAGEVRVHPIIGSHNALVEEPYVGGVGAAVRAALDAVLGA